MKDVFSKYRVVLSGRVLPEFEREEVAKGLAELFNSKPKNMENLLKGKPTPLKKEYERRQAEKICEKIQKLGAACRTQVIEEESIQLLDEETLPHPEMMEEDYGRRLKRTGATHYGSSVDDDSVQDPDFGRDRLINLVMVFVNTNIDYYRHAFNKFGNPRKPTYRLSWHWPAFFFFLLWALYRKLWMWAMLYVAGSIVIMMLPRPEMLSLIWLFAWPLSANYIYYRHAIAGARKAIQDPDHESTYMNRGGVSRIAAWCGFLILLAYTGMMSTYLTEQFFEQYGEQLEEVLPGSGSQTRGDGTNVVDPELSDDELASTSFKLSVLATSLKLILVTENQEDREKGLESYMDKISSDEIIDEWGSPIAITLTGDQYILSSAGPDTIIGTNDDILQPVPLQ